jgi:hypothetical protein
LPVLAARVEEAQVTFTPAVTASVALSPEFLAALRAIVPPRRPAKIPYIVGMGLLVVLGALAADGSTREFLASRWQHARVPPRATTPALVEMPRAAAPAATAIAPTEARIDNPVPSLALSTAAASATAPPPKKARPRRAGKHAATD